MEFSEIRGFGAKRIEALKENGIENVSDLLAVFPYSYIDLKNRVSPSAAVGKSTATVCVRVKDLPVVKYIRKGLFLTAVNMESENGEILKCSWFNRKYIKNTLKIGNKYYVIGKVERFGKQLSMNNPTLIADSGNLPDIYPQYRPIKGVPSNVFLAAIDTVLKNVRIESYIESDTVKKYGLTELNEAFKELHRPKDFLSLSKARQSVGIENLACNMALYSILKQSGKKKHIYKDSKAELNRFVDELPFRLSQDQSRALDEIIQDIQSENKMNRLLQGDVGCGKTIIALSAMLYAAMSGFQSVLMSPTELLARQHYETAKRLFANYGVEIAFLSSSVSMQQKKVILERLISGEILMLIGTHSLIRDDVKFRNLSLLITDEQQRFGVKQRGLLENKALDADYLVMSATPIPRTLALTLYGDLKQTEIHSMPLKKAKVFTRFVPQDRFADMLKYIKAKADNGEQTYMVCPRVDDEELVSVTSLFEMLSKTDLKPHLGILHGQQTDEEKKSAMDLFAQGKKNVIITTSIIEVGIDVPTATTMIIFNAERFGLSQLHQLRGRVGRGTDDSYCFLLSDAVNNEKTKERIEYFISCSDGFELAEYDFRLRGAGDFLGTKQHGNSILSDMDKNSVDTAREISVGLSESEHFRRKIFENTGKGQLTFIENLTLN